MKNTVQNIKLLRLMAENSGTSCFDAMADPVDEYRVCGVQPFFGGAGTDSVLRGMRAAHMGHFYTLSGENYWRLDSGLDSAPPLPTSSFRHHIINLGV